MMVIQILENNSKYSTEVEFSGFFEGKKSNLSKFGKYNFLFFSNLEYLNYLFLIWIDSIPRTIIKSPYNSSNNMLFWSNFVLPSKLVLIKIFGFKIKITLVSRLFLFLTRDA